MRIILCFMLAFVFTSCSISHYVNKEIKQSSVLKQQHTGLSISNLQDKKELAGYQSDKYFVPASNTKLFSFYAGVSALGDSIPGLEYLEWGELLIIRGTGDPSLMHPDLPKSKVFDFLKSRKEQIFFTSSNFQENRFGSGWAWSDYNDYYQPEISPLPVYGNIVRFTAGKNGVPKGTPKHWNKELSTDTTISSISRDEFSNVFKYPKAGLKAGTSQDLPIRMTDTLALKLLSDTLKKDIKHINIPLTIELQTVYSIPSDSLYNG